MNTTSKNSSGESSGMRKAGLSCAECRRSKLKCDRYFPCQACIRRGCGGICPEGTLAATKGNKFLMAHAQKLSEQVETLILRVRELEASQPKTLSDKSSGGNTATSSLQALGDRDIPHTSDDEGDSDDIRSLSHAIGSLSIGIDGQIKYYGESAGSEYLQELLSPVNEDPVASSAKHLELPDEIITLINAFPFGLKACPYSKLLFLAYLPTKERALELATLYYSNAAWMFNPIERQDFMSNILDPIYGAIGYITLNDLHSHRLSVFFVILANGALYTSSPYARALSEQYHSLARAAFSLDSVLVEATVATVQALFLIFAYIYHSDRNSSEERWLLTGLCVRIAQSIGLQRDSSGWKLPPEEVQRRRLLFWELFAWDGWSSIATGRPPALVIQHTDCHFPDDTNPSITQSGKVELGFHVWKERYTATCLSSSLQHVFSTRNPPYSDLLDIDKKIRRFPVPSSLRSPFERSDTGVWSEDPVIALRQHLVLCFRETNLLYIHRSYFVQAIRAESGNSLRHKYAPSILAVYRSACRSISSLRSLYSKYPEEAGRPWFFWTSIFSSCIVLGVLVLGNPNCSLASDALLELEHALPLYEEGSSSCRPPATLGMLQRLWRRASSAYASFKAGHIVAPGANFTDPSQPDEVELLGGRQFVITAKSSSNSPIAMNSDPSLDAIELLAEYYRKIGKEVDYDMDALRDGPPCSSSRGPIISERNVEPVEFHGISQNLTPAYDLSDLSQTYEPSDGICERKNYLDAWQPSYTDQMPPPPPLQHNSAPEGGSGFIPGQWQNQDEVWRNFILQFGDQDGK